MGDMNNIEPIMSNLVQLFQEAVIKEDIDQIKVVLSEFIKLSDDLGTSEHRSHNVAEKIGQPWPELASIKNQYGRTAIHMLSGSGDVEMVQFLENLNSKSRASQILIDEARVGTQENLQSQTALLEICNANSDDNVFSESSLILPRAAARQDTASPVQQSPELPARTTNDRNLIRWPIETRNVLLMVVGMIATLFFTVTINLPAPFFKEDYLADKPLSAKDLIAGHFPAVVYLMIFNSTGFMATMAATIVLVWPLRVRTILLLLAKCTCIVYIILVSKVVPKFSVRVGKFSVSSIALVWSIILALIFSGISILSLWNSTATLRRFIHRLRKKRTNYFSSRLGDGNA